MNKVNFNDNSFINTKTYQDFIKDNPSTGCLNIRTYSANYAVPIDGVRIIVSKKIDNYEVIFYEGLTDQSGMINSIILPTSSLNSNDLVVPKSTSYNIEAIYDNISKKYSALIYSNLCVVQDINIVPVGGM